MTMAGLAMMGDSAHAVVVNAPPRVSPIVPTGRYGSNAQTIRWPRAGGKVRVSSAHCPPPGQHRSGPCPVFGLAVKDLAESDLIGLSTLDAVYLKSAINAEYLTVRRG